MDQRSSELWLEAQRAWEVRDLDWLESVWWETEPVAAARGAAPVGTLARVVRAVRERIKQLQREWEMIRNTPAARLMVLKGKQRDRFRAEARWGMERELDQLRQQREELRFQEDQWQRLWELELAREKRTARKGKGKQPRGRPSLQAEFPF